MSLSGNEIRRKEDFPLIKLSQYASFPIPTGVTGPTPVITTRFLKFLTFIPFPDYFIILIDCPAICQDENIFYRL